MDSSQEEINNCQICLESNADKIDTSLFNCHCTFYSHPRCFLKFINSQQRHRTYLDCPICHSRINLNESTALVAIITNTFTNQPNNEVQHRLRTVNILICVMSLYLIFWICILGKQLFGF